MTPAEHSAEAERLIAKVVEDDGTPPGPIQADTGERWWVDATLALAQVHATLAATYPVPQRYVVGTTPDAVIR